MNLFDDILLPVIIGFTAMVPGGFWGMGGGWLIVPALLLLEIDTPVAVAASLLQMLPSTSITVFKQFPQIGWKKDGWGWTIAVPLCGASFFGGFLGKPAGIFLRDFFGSQKPHQALYLFLLGWIFYRTIFGKSKSKSEDNSLSDTNEDFKPKTLFTVIVGFFTGILSALLGIGGGTINRPLMKNILKVPEKPTGQIARLAVFVVAISGSLTYFSHWDKGSEQALMIAIALAVGGIVGFACGAKMHSIVLAGEDEEIASKGFASVVLLVFASVLCKLTEMIILGRVIIVISGVILISFLLFITWHSARQQRGTKNESKSI
jgi:uncharacterized membrane protein YfcA